MLDGFIIRSLPSNTQPESPGKESQGCPTVHAVKHLKVHDTSLEGVRLNARLDSYRSSARQHTS